MNSRTLRKIFTILVEKLARLEVFYESKKQIEDKANLEFINSCKEKLDGIKKELSGVSPLLKRTYEEETISQEEINRAFVVLKSCMDKFLELHSLLAHLPSNVIAPETYSFLSEVLKTKKTFHEFDSKIVLLTQDFLTRNTHKCCTNMPFIPDQEKVPLALYMPIIQITNPLYWPLLIKNAFANVESLKVVTKKHFDELIGSKKEIPEEKRIIAEKIAFKLIYDLFSLKLLGPAYYYLFIELGVFRSIAETKSRELPTLSFREMLLYNELKKSNLVDSVESSHDWFLSISNLSDDLHTALGFKADLSELKVGMKALVGRLNEEVDKVLSPEVLFKCNDLCVSYSGYEKLKKNILIASSTADELKISKMNCKEHLCENNENKDQVSNSSQHIINAGWFYAESVVDDIMRQVLENDDLSFKPFVDYIKQTDAILSDSIEKSRLFGILLDED